MKNEYKITKKEMLSWAKEYYLQGALNIFLFVLYLLLGLMSLFLIVLLSIKGGALSDFIISILLFVLSVYRLYFSRFSSWSYRYKLLSKTYGVTEWLRTTEFTDDEIILCDHTSVTKLKYENIKKIKEKNNIVMIFFNDNLAIRLYKDAFVEGSWEECKDKIDSMTK